MLAWFKRIQGEVSVLLGLSLFCILHDLVRMVESRPISPIM